MSQNIQEVSTKGVILLRVRAGGQRILCRQCSVLPFVSYPEIMDNCISYADQSVVPEGGSLTPPLSNFPSAVPLLVSSFDLCLNQFQNPSTLEKKGSTNGGVSGTSLISAKRGVEIREAF